MTKRRSGYYYSFRPSERYLPEIGFRFRAGTPVGDPPLNDINRIRTRTRVVVRTTARLTLAKILTECWIERAFERTHLHNLRRTRSNMDALFCHGLN